MICLGALSLDVCADVFDEDPDGSEVAVSAASDLEAVDTTWERSKWHRVR